MVMTKIKLRRSVWLTALLLVMSALATISIALAHVSVWIQLILATGVLGGLSYAIGCLRKPMPCIRIKADGRIQISIGDSEWQSTETMPGSYVSTGLSVVRLRTQHKTHRLVLMRDSATPDELRRLRLSLRWVPRTRSDTAFPGAG